MKDGWAGLVELMVYEMRSVASALHKDEIGKVGAAQVLYDCATQAETLATLADAPIDKSKWPKLSDFIKEQEN